MAEIVNFRGEPQAADLSGSAGQALLQRVGDRVRKARNVKGIPRRVLSEMSGVSQRYLAQLEAGEGNISIALLLRVADALDVTLETLIIEEDPWDSDYTRFQTLFRGADRSVRRQVLELLTNESLGDSRARRVCLIGLRGAGKTTLGRAAGDELGMPFLELNREIEDHSGMPISEIMEFYGQEGYRRLEAQAIQRVIESHDSVILAVAGGIVAEPSVYETLLAHFHAIWVKATPEDHMDRVRAQGDERPMAGNPEAMSQLRSILSTREALYGKAHAQLETSGKSVPQATADLVTLIRGLGIPA
jgi:XRE family aerobic/anaerobic benzoate catabolism transcriptional regulator